jgi:hypothetical protein
VPLVGIERGHRADAGLELLAAALDPRAPVDDDDERVLLHLVIAELLSGEEPDQHGAALLGRVEDDRRATPVGGLDLGQLPAPHAAILTGVWSGEEARLDSPP